MRVCVRRVVGGETSRSMFTKKSDNFCATVQMGASPDQFDSVQSCIQTCIGDDIIWMNSNELKLNTD